MKPTIFPFALVLLMTLGLTVIQCNGDDDDEDNDGDTIDEDSGTESETESETEQGMVANIEATITVPDTFDAVPVKIIAAFYSTRDVSGMPDGLGIQQENPAIGPSTPYQLVTHAASFSDPNEPLVGDYYLNVALYVEGGGAVQPVPGVDWGGQAAELITLGGTDTVAAGTIELQVIPEPIP